MKTTNPAQITIPATRALLGTQCPECYRQTISYSIAARMVRCLLCGWAVEVAPAEHADIVRGVCFNQDLSSYLLLIHARCCPAPEPPPAVIADRSGDGIKSRVIPAKDETPAEALQRKADQACLNGCEVFPRDGVIIATSQRRDEVTLAPVREYTIEAMGCGWRCTCEAVVFCAHLARLWKHYTDTLADPDQLLTDKKRARMVDAVYSLERQAGLHKAPPVADPVSELFGPVAA